MKFMNKRSVAAAANSLSQPSNTSVKIKGHIGHRIPESRIIKGDPKLYEINFSHKKKRYANGLETCSRCFLMLECL